MPVNVTGDKNVYENIDSLNNKVDSINTFERVSYTFTRPATSGSWSQSFNVPKGNWLFIGNCDLSGSTGNEDAQFNVPVLGSHYWCCDSAGGDSSRESQGIGVISASSDTTETFSIWTNADIGGSVYINLIRLR